MARRNSASLNPFFAAKASACPPSEIIPGEQKNIHEYPG
jgi:hypothetical protein